MENGQVPENYYQTLRERITQQYRKIGSLYCAAIGQYVTFNAKGLYHLRYKVSGQERTIKEQAYKFNLFPLVIPVIKNARQVAYSKGKFTVDRRGSKKNVEYWALSANVGKNAPEVKVILRRIGTGKIVFWSVMKKKQKKNRPL